MQSCIEKFTFMYLNLPLLTCFLRYLKNYSKSNRFARLKFGFVSVLLPVLFFPSVVYNSSRVEVRQWHSFYIAKGVMPKQGFICWPKVNKSFKDEWIFRTDFPLQAFYCCSIPTVNYYSLVLRHSLWSKCTFEISTVRPWNEGQTVEPVTVVT